MLDHITLKHLRTGAWATVGLGIVVSLGFALGFHRSVCLEQLVWDMPPYVLIATATGISGTRGLALVALLAALSVLALGAYTYIDLTRYAGGINDIQLLTAPWQWLLSLLALLAASIGFVMRKIKHAQASL